MRKLIVPVALAVTGVGIWIYRSFRTKKKVFISYHYDNEATYKNLLKAWSKNTKFALEFDDHSTDISVNSTDESVIKRAISRKIKEADIFCCLIGEDTHNRPMVTWEIEKAKELNKKLVAIKIKKSYVSPQGLKSEGAIWATSFNQKAIEKAFNNMWE